MPEKRTLLWSFLTLALFTSSLVIWHRCDTRPPAWDESVHLHLALDYRDFLLHRTPITTSWADVYPPAYHLSLIPFLSIGIPSTHQTAWPHAIYFALMLAAFVAFAKSFSLPEESGVWTALFIVGYAFVHWVARWPLMDFAVMSWVTIGILFLWRTNYFQDIRQTVLWGVLSGLGLLIKPFYGFNFVFPCIYLLACRTETSRARRFANFLIGCGAAALIALTWYGWEGACFLRNVVYLAGERGAVEGDPSFTTLAGWWYYIRCLWIQMGPYGLTLTLGGIIALIIKRPRLPRGSVGFLAACALSSYICLTFARNKNPRYDMGILPPLALLAAAGWFSTFTRRWARAGLGAAALVLFLYSAARTDPPRTENWQHLAIGEEMEKTRDPAQSLLLVSVASNHRYLFARNLRWSLRAHGQAIAPCKEGDPTADFSEFIVVKTGDRGPDAEDLNKDWDRLRLSGRAFDELFQMTRRFSLPDGSEALLYRRNPAVVFQGVPVTHRSLHARLVDIFHDQIRGPLILSFTGTPEDWRRGRFPGMVIEGQSCNINGLPVSRLRVEATSLWLNLYRVWGQKRLGLLAVSSLQPSVEGPA